MFDCAKKESLQQALRDALIAFMAAPSDAKAEAKKEAQVAGVSHAKPTIGNVGRKSSFTHKQRRIVKDLASARRGRQP